MIRRDFLRRSAIALAGGLVLGPEALEAFERLTHVRKSFPSADLNGWKHVTTTGDILYLKKPYGVLYGRRDHRSAWVELDRAPLLDNRVVFRKGTIGAEYTEGRYALVMPQELPTITASLWME